MRAVSPRSSSAIVTELVERRHPKKLCVVSGL